MWRRRLLRAGWWILITCVFLAPYAQLGFWPFPASTAVLIALFLLRWRATAMRRIGLRLGARQGGSALLLALALWAFFEFALAPWIAGDAGLVRRAISGWQVAVFPFQALNEEMVLGALILIPLVDRWRRPILWSMLLAAVFAGLHYALYRYGTLGAHLAPLTLVGLTAVGCVRHAAILLARHIGFAWAVHAAWNLVMFAGTWWVHMGNRKLTEPEVFDAFLGDARMVTLAAVGACVLLLVLGARSSRGSAEPGSTAPR